MASLIGRNLSRCLSSNGAALPQLSRRNFRSDLFGTDVYRWTKKDDLAYLRAMEYIEPKPQTVKVAVTGASGNIGYALLFRLARYVCFLYL